MRSEGKEEHEITETPQPKTIPDPARVSTTNKALNVPKGAGKPLDTSTRVYMESRFGHDFSQVRVHADTEAALATRKVHAKAFTEGHDVVFGRGQYAPYATAGKKLLAHELSHVIQQRRGRNLPLSFSPSVEQAADQAASSIVRGHGLVHVQGASGAGLLRQEIVELGPEETAELIKFWEEKVKTEPTAKKRARYQGYIQRLKRGERPSGAQAEEEMRYFYRQTGPAEEKAYKHGSPAPRGGPGSKGSTKPDIPLSSADIEVKARDITDPQNAKSIIQKIKAQTIARREGGRAYVTRQPVILDLRGQKVTRTQIDNFVHDLSTTAKIAKEDIQVVVNEGQLAKIPKPAPTVPLATPTPTRLPTAEPGKGLKAPEKTLEPRPTEPSKPPERPVKKIVEPAPGAKKTQFRDARRVEYPGLRSGGPPATLRGMGPTKAVTLGEGLAQLMPEALNVWQDLTIRHAVAGRMLNKWSTLEQWRRDYPQDVIVCVVSLQESEPDGSGMVARGINYVQFYHGPDQAAAQAEWSKSLVSSPSGRWKEVGPFFGWIQPTESLAELKAGVESKRMCFIATACYHTPLSAEVCLLREFRDIVLLRSILGRKFVETYYMVSPPIAAFLRDHHYFRALVRYALLSPLVSLINHQAGRWKQVARVKLEN